MCYWKLENLVSTFQGCTSHVNRVAGIVLLSLFFGGIHLSAEEIDRLLFAVNGVVVTEGDLHIARSLNALEFPDGQSSPVSRKKEIDSLINLELMWQELKNFSMDPEDEISVDARAKALFEEYAGRDISRILRRHGLQESELIFLLKRRISILEFVEFRFGPEAYVSEADIKDYFDESLKPQLQASGVAVPSLDQVSSQIKAILKETKINDALDQWTLDARSNARIDYFNNDLLSDNSDVPGEEEFYNPSSSESWRKVP